MSDARRLSSSLDDTDARDEAIYAGLFLVHLMIILQVGQRSVADI